MDRQLCRRLLLLRELVSLCLRIAAINFLNPVPLMWDFEHDPTPELIHNFRIEYTVPALCAQSLREGSADIGIIPVITTATMTHNATAKAVCQTRPCSSDVVG